MENPIFVSYKRKVYLAVNSMRVLVMIQVSFVFICSIYINKFYFFPFATLNILLKKKITKKKKKKKNTTRTILPFCDIRGGNKLFFQG